MIVISWITWAKLQTVRGYVYVFLCVHVCVGKEKKTVFLCACLCVALCCVVSCRVVLCCVVVVVAVVVVEVVVVCYVGLMSSSAV